MPDQKKMENKDDERGIGLRAWLLAAAVLGYCLLTCIPTIGSVLVMSYTPLTSWSEEDEGFPETNKSIYWGFGPTAWCAIAVAFTATSNMAIPGSKEGYTEYGPRLAWGVTFPLYVVAGLTVGIGLPSLLTYVGFNLRFYLVDLLLLPLSFIFAMALDVSLRPKVASRIHPSNESTTSETAVEDQDGLQNLQRASLRLSVVEANNDPTVLPNNSEEPNDKEKTFIARHKRAIDWLLSVFFYCGYPILLVP